MLLEVNYAARKPLEMPEIFWLLSMAMRIKCAYWRAIIHPLAALPCGAKAPWVCSPKALISRTPFRGIAHYVAQLIPRNRRFSCGPLCAKKRRIVCKHSAAHIKSTCIAGGFGEIYFCVSRLLLLEFLKFVCLLMVANGMYVPYMRPLLCMNCLHISG